MFAPVVPIMNTPWAMVFSGISLVMSISLSAMTRLPVTAPGRYARFSGGTPRWGTRTIALLREHAFPAEYRSRRSHGLYFGYSIVGNFPTRPEQYGRKTGVHSAP